MTHILTQMVGSLVGGGLAFFLGLSWLFGAEPPCHPSDREHRA